MAKTSTQRAGGDPRLTGRADELAALAAALDGGARLVTLTGAFGVGKTALARELARTGASRDGEALAITLVELADVEAGPALLDAVTSALGRGGRSAKGGVTRTLAAAGPLVLVLDPFDRLLEAASMITGWLDEAPELSVVLVSRERLGVQDETVIELAPLAIDDGVALLESLGQRHRSGFSPTDAERAALRKIVERLDAIPLALELAAPRLAVMAPDALLYRLENRWDVLRRSGKEGDRHAALETSLRWSLELLEAPARSVLAALTVFRGGLTIEAAEAVIPAPAGPPLLDVLQSLRARSLVRAEEDEATGELRLSLLSSVRDLAARELAPEARTALEERHAAHYVDLAEREARAAELEGSARARARLSRERENLLAVVSGILGKGPVSARAADRALRALCAVGPSLVAEGMGEEVARDLEHGLAVAQGSGADPRLIARAMVLRAEVRAERGQRAAAESDLAQALVLAHHAGDVALEARVLLAAAASAVEAGEPSRAAAGVARARELGASALDTSLVARALVLEGAIAEHAGDLVGARLAYEESLARARALALPYAEIDAGRALALLDLREGAVEPMGARVGAARAVARRLGHRRSEAVLAALAGVQAQLRGEVAQALTEHEDAARLAREAAMDAEQPWLAGLAAIARAEAGERGEARAGFAEARSASVPPDFAAVFAIASARLSRSAGRAAEADETLRAAALLVPRVRDRVVAALVADTTAEGSSGLAALALRVPASASPSIAPEADDARVLRLGPGATWFRPPGGARVDLSRRKPLRLILDRLARARDEGDGEGLGWDALLEAGWPGEKMRADAGAHRVRVAVSTLRKMGLGAVLRTGESGYALAPEVPIERSA